MKPIPVAGFSLALLLLIGLAGSDRTAEAASSSDEFTFAIIGDTHRLKTGSSLAKAVKKIKKKNPKLVFAMGDLTDECSSEQKCRSDFSKWKKIIKSISSKTYEVMGDHDRTESSADAAWRDTFSLPTNGPDGFSELTYSFDHGNSHFVVLNSEVPEDHRVNEAQRDWLKQDLNSTSKDHIFVFVHEPAYPVGPEIDDSLDSHESDRDDLWEILDDHEVTAVFSGHEHLFARKKIDGDNFDSAKHGIYQFIVGNTDSNVGDTASETVEKFYGDKHYVLMEVDGDEVTQKLYSLDGTLQDEITFER